jgi:hypothetical protein
MSDAKEGNSDQKQSPLFVKGTTLEKLMGKFEQKATTERGKVFEQKFSAKYKEYANAEAITKGLHLELEKLFVEFNEGI